MILGFNVKSPSVSVDSLSENQIQVRAKVFFFFRIDDFISYA